jgi:hypothetical protein
MDARELVPPDSYQYCNSKGLDPLILIDSRLVSVYKTIKKYFPQAYVNNWHKGGKLQQSGYRNDGSGAPVSQHRFGRAIDIHGVTPIVLYNHIRKWRLIHYRAITAIEALQDTPSWLHIDVRYSQAGFQIVRG